MMLAETQSPADGTLPLWFLILAVTCLPFTAVAIWRLAQWWNSFRPVPLPLDGALPRVWWPAWFGLMLFVIVQLAMQVAIWLYFMVEDAHLIPPTPDDWPLILHPGVFLGQVVPAAVGLGIVFLFGRSAAKAIGVRLGRFRYGLVYGIVAFAAVTPACLVVNWISNYIAILLGVSPKLHPLLEVAEKAEGPWILPLALLLAGVLAPLVEEFLFRGVLLMSLIRPMGAAGAIGVTSLIFALLHYTNEPQAVPPLLLLGVVLGYLAYRTRSLVAPIVTHALFNTVMIMQAFGGG